MSTTTDSDLITALDHDISEVEIKESWWKLFNHFHDAVDEARKLKVKDIKRQSKKAMVEDIVYHLRKKESSSDLRNFAFPWYYIQKVFQSESQQISEAWQTATIKDTEERLNCLEKNVELSHNRLISDLKAWSADLIKMLPPPQGSLSYSTVLSNPASMTNYNNLNQGRIWY